MTHTEAFLKDLAIIMMAAGFITLVFHRFKQPVVLGYILAGIIIGPHTPPFPLISDRDTIQTLADLGVVFLLFSLGLEFNISKLKKVGGTALIAGTAEISLMLWAGYSLGRAFGWSEMDAIFLGAMLSISSTTIIVKALDELNLKRERFAQFIFGVLIVEDILAIAMIVLLSGLALTGEVSVSSVANTLGRLGIFLVVALLLGLLLVPRLLSVVSRYQSKEMLLITVLGLCFGFCLLVVELGYSMALGAFVMGAIIAESKQIHVIERLVEPLRDMFTAIFFVAIGMMVDPSVLVEYWLPILIITGVVVLGKTTANTLATIATGHDARTSLKVGMGLSQIGEFSFIIASLGVTLGVTSGFLYPVVVSVSVLTTILTPYLIKNSDLAASTLRHLVPSSLQGSLTAYENWLGSIGSSAQESQVSAFIRRILLHVVLNFCVIAALFLAGAALVNHTDITEWLAILPLEWRSTVFWAATLILAMPFMVATYRKLEALAMILTELGAGVATTPSRVVLHRLFARALPSASLVAMLLLISALSSIILPPLHLFVAVLVLVLLLALALWPRVVRWHSQLQVALRDTIAQQADDPHH
ncbi:MAG: cation:proton antiporter [Paraperlucidibaca sp.]